MANRQMPHVQAPGAQGEIAPFAGQALPAPHMMVKMLGSGWGWTRRGLHPHPPRLHQKMPPGAGLVYVRGESGPLLTPEPQPAHVTTTVGGVRKSLPRSSLQ